MTTLIPSHPGRPGVFTLRRAKLFWCQRFHKKRRRRVAFSANETSGHCYEVRCLKCGTSDIEIIDFQKARMRA